MLGYKILGGTKAMPWGYQNHWRDSKYTRIFCVGVQNPLHGVQNPLGYFAWGDKILGVPTRGTSIIDVHSALVIHNARSLD